MDPSRSLRALFKAPRPAVAAPASVGERYPDSVYEAARVIRGRIDAALAASRGEDPQKRSR